MKKAVVRLNGHVINIGPWDYQREPILADDLDKPIFEDMNDKPIVKNGETVGYQKRLSGFVQKQVGERIRNPLPEGAVVFEEEVVERADGGLAAAEDYASLRRAKYPTLADQLDALWKCGTAEDEMRARIMAIKSEYPKPQ